MYIIEFLFPKSKSIAHASAVNIARNATEYKQVNIENSLLHTAKFELNNFEQANLALQLIQLIWNLKGVSIKTGNKVAPSTFGHYLWLMDILKCYVQSVHCTDYKAHCWTIETTLVPEEVVGLREVQNSIFMVDGKIMKQIYFCYPCSHILSQKHKIDLLHPSSLKDQLLAIAVKEGLDWCPALNIDDAIIETQRINKPTVEINKENKHLLK